MTAAQLRRMTGVCSLATRELFQEIATSLHGGSLRNDGFASCVRNAPGSIGASSVYAGLSVVFGVAGWISMLARPDGTLRRCMEREPGMIDDGKRRMMVEALPGYE